MSTLTLVVGTDNQALYVDGEHQKEAYGDELWNRGFVLDIVDKYDIEDVNTVVSPGATTFPDTLEELENSDEWKYDSDARVSYMR